MLAPWADGVHLTKELGEGDGIFGRDMKLDNEQPQEWFPAPSLRDDTYARRGEPTTLWLQRSTVARAMACRRFLNENLSVLPETHQSVLYLALHDRWHSAFFELIVARTLQVLGADIEVEPDSEAGTRIDFLARFPDCKVSVEAVALVINAATGEEVKRRNPLLDIIDSLAPPGWTIWVMELPDLGPSDSKKRFKEAVEDLLDGEKRPDTGSGFKDLIAELPSGRVHLRLLPQRGSGVSARPAVGGEPPLTAWNNSEQRIRRAVKQKRRQGRNVGTPALLAIHATGISSSFKDFDLALYGREVGIFDVEEARITGTRFQANGEFNKGSGVPTWAAVLAFVNVDFPGGPEPVLYTHPRFRGDLPEYLSSIEQRTYDPRTGMVVVQSSQRAGFFKQLGFVSV